MPGLMRQCREVAVGGLPPCGPSCTEQQREKQTLPTRQTAGRGAGARTANCETRRSGLGPAPDTAPPEDSKALEAASWCSRAEAAAAVDRDSCSRVPATSVTHVSEVVPAHAASRQKARSHRPPSALSALSLWLVRPQRHGPRCRSSCWSPVGRRSPGRGSEASCSSEHDNERPGRGVASRRRRGGLCPRRAFCKEPARSVPA